MKFLKQLAAFVTISSLVSSTACKDSATTPWPDLPFHTSGRQIKTASGLTFIPAGVNWPGAADTMLPEGLQYASIAFIVSQIKSLGLNIIRLTYAVEMIDDHYNNSPNQTLKNTLINALGQTNGSSVFASIIKHNPSFSAKTTRLQVFDAVAAECAKQHIYVHLDNHMSKAEWCCSFTDGNGWFGDTYFIVQNWYRALGFMARHVKSWTSLASMSLRNEPRPALDMPNNAAPYTWKSWYEYMVPATHVINSNNSAPLIYLSGVNSDTTDDAITRNNMMALGHSFNISTFSYANKLVFELHNYYLVPMTCPQMQYGLLQHGYSAMNVRDSTFPNHAPVILSEFGFSMRDGSMNSTYAQCIKGFLPSRPGGPGGWMQWVLAGSYYIRQGIQNYDETYGYFNRDWTAWRNQTVIDTYVKPLIQATLG